MQPESSPHLHWTPWLCNSPSSLGCSGKSHGWAFFGSYVLCLILCQVRFSLIFWLSRASCVHTGPSSSGYSVLIFTLGLLSNFCYVTVLRNPVPARWKVTGCLNLIYLMSLCGHVCVWMCVCACLLEDSNISSNCIFWRCQWKIERFLVFLILLESSWCILCLHQYECS